MDHVIQTRKRRIIKEDHTKSNSLRLDLLMNLKVIDTAFWRESQRTCLHDGKSSGAKPSPMQP
jgi:hypothetical protein